MPDVAAALPFHGEAPEGLRAVAEALQTARTSLAGAHGLLTDATGSIRRAWIGAAGRLGDAELTTGAVLLDDAQERLDTAVTALLRCADELRSTRVETGTLRSEWSTAQRRIAQLTLVPACDAATEAQRVAALERLSAEVDRIEGDAQRTAARAAAAVEACRRVLTASVQGEWRYRSGTGVGRDGLAAALGATRLIADDVFRDRLSHDPVVGWASLTPEAQAMIQALNSVFTPPSGALASARWWADLDPVTQQAMIAVHSAAVGSTDGLPVVVRDQANRLVLAAELEAGAEQLAAPPISTAFAVGAGTMWAAAPPAWYRAPGPPEEENTWLRRFQAAGGVADVLGPGRYLVNLDVANRGAAVIAVGNPDTASHVVTLIPGTGTGPDGLATVLGRAEVMVDAALVAGADQPAAVAWLGYDTPPGLPDAGFDRYADDAAEPLGSFLDGLRASHVGPAPSLTTLIGHSYGGLVITAASDRAPLPVDQIVFVASAGLELRGVHDLRLAGVPAETLPGRIFATVNEFDFINLTGFIHSGLPTEDGFGATEFVSDLPGVSLMERAPAGFFESVLLPGVQVFSALDLMIETHSAYWDPGWTTGSAFGAIIAGRPLPSQLMVAPR